MKQAINKNSIFLDIDSYSLASRIYCRIAAYLLLTNMFYIFILELVQYYWQWSNNNISSMSTADAFETVSARKSQYYVIPQLIHLILYLKKKSEYFQLNLVITLFVCYVQNKKFIHYSKLLILTNTLYFLSFKEINVYGCV